jgi:soluble lytic murein transglycosylase-like protein
MGVGGCEKYRHIIEQYTGWDVDIMLAICKYESGGNPKADNWNDVHKGCIGSFGLMQIACLHGVDREALHDPSTNIRVAYRVWKDGGYHPWTTYKKVLARL